MTKTQKAPNEKYLIDNLITKLQKTKSYYKYKN